MISSEPCFVSNTYQPWCRMSQRSAKIRRGVIARQFTLDVGLTATTRPTSPFERDEPSLCPTCSFLVVDEAITRLSSRSKEEADLGLLVVKGRVDQGEQAGFLRVDFPGKLLRSTGRDSSSWPQAYTPEWREKLNQQSRGKQRSFRDGRG